MMSEAGLKAMLDRKQFEVKVTGGHFAGRVGTVQIHDGDGWIIVRLPGIEDPAWVHLDDLAPAYPAHPPDLLREYNDPRQREVREPGLNVRIGPGTGPRGLPPSLQDIELTEADIEAILQAAQEGPSEVVRRLGEKPYQAPTRPATLATTWMGVLAWQAARPSDRRIHAGVTGHVVTVWATSIASGYATREVKFFEPLPADLVPAAIDRAFAEPTPPHLAVACGYDGTTDLFGEVG